MTPFEQFKTSPIQAFYNLLFSNMVFLWLASLLFSIPVFGWIHFGMDRWVGSSATSELNKIFTGNISNGEELKEQSERMKEIIQDHPSMIPFILVTLLFIALWSSYFIFIQQRFVKFKKLEGGTNWRSVLMPDKRFLQVCLFILVILGLLFFSSGFIALILAVNPIIGLVILVLMLLLILRRALVIPAICIGETDFYSASSFSSEMIGMGRAFKILIFGIVVFLFLSTLVSLIFYFPIKQFGQSEFKYFMNLWMLFIQIGLIGIGLSALFFRYGSFSEEKITE
ncbi:MAG: hypothetical protein H6605_09570 [Flavobacteriales bacterium]|nr:hypothetical protein [Flavobacteriales bacterium]